MVVDEYYRRRVDQPFRHLSLGTCKHSLWNYSETFTVDSHYLEFQRDSLKYLDISDLQN